MGKAIRFIRDWHQFKAGQVNSTLDFGMMDALVNHRRTAVWVEESEPKADTKKSSRRSQKETS